MKRLFVVGCSRSGTSVVQKIIVDHFGLWSLPETAFFKNLGETAISRADAITLLVDILDYGAKVELKPGQRVLRSLRSLTQKVGTKDALGAFLSTQRAANAFTRLMDDSAHERSAQGWVEKTPLHCLCIDRILRRVPGAQIVFVMRDGEAVTASILDRARRYPEQFSYQDDVRWAVALWNQCIAEAAKWQNHSAVHLVCYELLTADLPLLVGKMRRVLQLEPRALDEGTSWEQVNIVSDNEPWKAGLNERIHPARSKFLEIFCENDQRYVREHLNVELYRRLVGGVSKSSLPFE